MQRKSEIDMERHRILKTTRALIRLKHSLAADIELNAVLPDRLIEFDKALQNGYLLEVGEGWEDAKE